MTTFFPHSSYYFISRLANVNLGCMSLEFGSRLGILYDQYRGISRKSTQDIEI